MSIQKDSVPIPPTEVTEISNTTNNEIPNQIKAVENSERKKFTERHDFNLEVDFEYQRPGIDPGILVIFSNDFEGKLFRTGNRRDVNEIALTFSRLGFNVDREQDVHMDLTAEEINKKLNAILEDKTRLQQANCLIIFFLTHGSDSEKLLLPRGGDITTDGIYKRFNDCPELTHKPKLFIFQACKGGSASQLTTPNLDKLPPANPTLIDPDYFKADKIGDDMLIAFSSSEGNTSFRHSTQGTWFIQELCKNFLAYGRRDDVITLLTRINKCIAGNYYLEEENLYIKQMPIFVSTLSKKFYLNRSKDRHVLLKIHKEVQELHDDVKKIAKALKIK